MNCGLVTGFGVSCLQMGLYPIPWHLPYNGKPRECHCSRSFTPTSCIEIVVQPSVLKFTIPGIERSVSMPTALKITAALGLALECNSGVGKTPSGVETATSGVETALPPALEVSSGVRTSFNA